jgi:hypothetical protein
MNTARTLMAAVGQHGRVKLDGISVVVKIEDARDRFGQQDYRITPLYSADSKWVCANRVEVIGTLDVPPKLRILETYALSPEDKSFQVKA